MRGLRKVAALWILSHGSLVSAPVEAHGVRLDVEARAAAVSGQVRYADGTALRGAQVALSPVISAEWSGASDEPAASSAGKPAMAWQTSADPEGHFRFEAVPAGDYQVIAKDGLGHRAVLPVTVQPVSPASSVQVESTGERWQWHDLLAGLGLIAGLWALLTWFVARRRSPI